MKRRKAGEPPKVDVSPDTHLTYLIAKVEHRLTLRLDRALQSCGITLTQFSALAHIGANPGLSSADLARALLTTPQAVTTLLRRLSGVGMITQNQPPRGHAGALYLTEKGAGRLLAAAELASQAERENLAALSLDEQATLFAQLTRLHESLSA